MPNAEDAENSTQLLDRVHAARKGPAWHKFTPVSILLRRKGDDGVLRQAVVPRHDAQGVDALGVGGADPKQYDVHLQLEMWCCQRHLFAKQVARVPLPTADNLPGSRYRCDRFTEVQYKHITASRHDNELPEKGPAARPAGWASCSRLQGARQDVTIGHLALCRALENFPGWAWLCCWSTPRRSGPSCRPPWLAAPPSCCWPPSIGPVLHPDSATAAVAGVSAGSRTHRESVPPAVLHAAAGSKACTVPPTNCPQTVAKKKQCRVSRLTRLTCQSVSRSLLRKGSRPSVAPPCWRADALHTARRLSHRRGAPA